MILNSRNILLFLIVTLFSNNVYSYSKKTPQWVIAPKSFYNETEYLTGVGEGSTLEIAKNQAFANLASVFGTTIKQNVRSTETLSDVKGKASSDASVEQDIKLASEHNLVNVTIEKTYRDKRAKTYYALAIMNKEDTLNILENMILENLKDVASYVQSASTESDSLKKYYLLDYAVNIAQKNDVYIGQMTHLNINKARAVSIPSNLTSQVLRDEAYNVLSQIKFDVAMSDVGDPLAGTIRKMLGNIGFNVSSNNPTYKFIDQVYTKGSEIYGLYSMDYTVSIILVNVQTGVEIKTFNFTGKDVGSNESDATSNAINYLSRTIDGSLSSQFNEFLNGILK